MNNGLTFGTFTGGTGALSPNSQVQLASGAILDLNGASTPSGGLGDVAGAGGTVTSSSSGIAVMGLGPVGTASFGGVIEDGAGTVGITKSGAGAQILTGNNTYTGTTTVQGGRLILASTGAQSAALVAGRGGADVQAGRLVFDYNTNSDPLTQVQTILGAGYNQPTKFSSGLIRSSTTTSTIGLAYVDDTTAKQLTVVRALYGDANLDNVVNALDFNAVAANYGATSQQWINGDFTYDGTVNSADFTALSGGFGLTLPAPAPALGALVPEPGAILMLAGVGAIASRRRRVRG
jgi:autotransporter-associated beta strand protein